MGGKVKYDGCKREISWGCRLKGELYFFINLFCGVGLLLGSCRVATVIGAGDGMGRGGRERNILGNSKLTYCHEAAGYVKGLVVGKKVGVGVWVRVRVGIRVRIGVSVEVWLGVGSTECKVKGGGVRWG